MPKDDRRRTTVSVAVDGMSCASCVGRVEKAIRAVPGVADAAVNLATGRAEVTFSADEADAGAVADRIRRAGYEAEVLGDAPGGADFESSARDREAREAETREREIGGLKRAVILSAALTLPIFVLDMGGHLIPPFHHAVLGTLGTQNLYYLLFVLATIVQFGPGLRFYRRAGRRCCAARRT
jgi:cation transport ATPase